MTFLTLPLKFATQADILGKYKSHKCSVVQCRTVHGSLTCLLSFNVGGKFSLDLTTEKGLCMKLLVPKFRFKEVKYYLP